MNRLIDRATIMCNVELTDNTKEYIKQCGERMLDIREKTDTYPDMDIMYVGEQCAVMTWFIVSQATTIDLDFNECLNHIL